MDANAQALQRAIAAVGSRYALARRLEIKPQAVYQWTEVPLGRVAQVSALTGIPVGELRPDLRGA